MNTDIRNKIRALIPSSAQVSEQHQHIKCAKYPSLLAYHEGISGLGALDFTWKDKPHRLVYDLTNMLAEVYSALETILLDSAHIDECIICGKQNDHNHDMSEGKWIGVDFDSTLAYDSPDRSDAYSLGEPIPEMVERVKQWLSLGYRIKILTARMNKYSYAASKTGKMRDLSKMELMLQEWCLTHIGEEVEYTCEKDGLMEVLWDDRAVNVSYDRKIINV